MIVPDNRHYSSNWDYDSDSDYDTDPVPNSKTSIIINETIGMVNKLVQMGVSDNNIFLLTVRNILVQ